MANKSKKTPAATKKPTSETSITRIKASDLSPVVIPRKKSSKKTLPANKVVSARSKSPLKVLRSIGGYFKGAWFELRQVRWPNRRATWSLTAAVLIFTAFFVLLVVLLDILFKYLFQLILG